MNKVDFGLIFENLFSIFGYIQMRYCKIDLWYWKGNKIEHFRVIQITPVLGSLQ